MEALNNFVESNTHIAVSVTFADFHLLVDLFFFPVNLLSFPSVRLSETTETIAAGLGGVRLLQDTRGRCFEQDFGNVKERTKRAVLEIYCAHFLLALFVLAGLG